MATRAVRPARGLGWGNILVVGAATTLLTFTLMALSFGLSPGPTRGTAISLALIIHVGTVLPALPLGAYILLRRKGGRLHRLLGRVWAGLMVTTAISSFWLGDEGLSFIHLFSMMTLISVPLAIFWIRRGDVQRHQRTMTYVYIGLVVAGLFAFTPGRLFATWLFG
jgi:uncharacterized membrane protein